MGNRSISLLQYELRTPAYLIRRAKTYKIRPLLYEVAQYRMDPKDTIIDHVKEVNEKFKNIHSKGHIMSEEAKYKASYNTVPPNFQNILKRF